MLQYLLLQKKYTEQHNNLTTVHLQPCDFKIGYALGFLGKFEDVGEQPPNRSFCTFRNHHWYTNAPEHVEITGFGAVFRTPDTDIIAY